MIWVGFVDRRAVRCCSDELEEMLGAPASVLVGDLDPPDGFPVVFNDGVPLEQVNDFLRSAPVALSSVRKYAADLAALARWAQSSDKTLFTLTGEDLLRYRRALTDPPPGNGRRPLSPGRWNDLVAVFSTFFRWNVHLGKIERSPIPRWPDGKGRERLKLRTVAEQRIRFLTADEIRVLRSAGFEDDRERLFLDLVLSTGTRRQEMARVCWADLPGLGSSRGYEALWVLGKGCKARVVDVPRLLFGQIASYRFGDREDIVLAHQDGYERRVAAGEMLEYRLAPKRDRQARAVLVRGNERRPTLAFTRTDVLARVVIRRDDDRLDPAALFLGVRHGHMLGERHWNAAFDAAEQRCAGTDGAPARVTPHMLRHTFAVHLLAALVAEAASNGLTPTFELIEHPLKTVQRTLGHASPLTTYRFYIEAAQRFRGPIYRALDEMGRALLNEGG